jgi:ADP-L-glycero-D-manno-heptose 6-epimerase
MFSKDKETKGYIELYLGSENFRRDFVSVEQIVETQMKFLSVPESGIWNIGTGKTKSFYEIALEFDSVISWNVMSQKMMHNYQKYTCADITKLNSTLAKYGLI